MKFEKSSVSLALIALVAGVGLGLLLATNAAFVTAQADVLQNSRSGSRTESRRDDTRWEYCAITRPAVSASLPRGSYTLTYFRGSGVDSTPIEESATDRGALARTIAKLGDDGWELIGEGRLEFKSNLSGEALYFKRRR
jgi:hypothetical protein